MRFPPSQTNFPALRGSGYVRLASVHLWDGSLPTLQAPKDLNRAKGQQATMFSAQETEALSLKAADGEEITSW